MKISSCILLSRLLVIFVINLVFNVWINYEAYTSLAHYKTNHVGDAKSEKYRDGLILLIMFTVVGVLLLSLGPVLLLWPRYASLLFQLISLNLQSNTKNNALFLAFIKQSKFRFMKNARKMKMKKANFLLKAPRIFNSIG